MLISHSVATLELRKKGKESERLITGLITIRLSVADVTQANKTVLSNVRKDIQRGEIAGSVATSHAPLKVVDTVVGLVEEFPQVPDFLFNVVSKLEVFVNIVDRASKVNGFWSH
jgi:hypothetical protein